MGERKGARRLDERPLVLITLAHVVTSQKVSSRPRGVCAHRRGHLNPAGSYLRAIGRIRWWRPCAHPWGTAPHGGWGDGRSRPSLCIIREIRLKLGLNCDDASFSPNECGEIPLSFCPGDGVATRKAPSHPGTNLPYFTMRPGSLRPRDGGRRSRRRRDRCPRRRIGDQPEVPRGPSSLSRRTGHTRALRVPNRSRRA